MSDLDAKEQQYVRVALRHLHRTLGAWAPVAAGLKTTAVTVRMVACGQNAVSASLALRVARLLNVMVDDLLVGRFLPPGACPNCGHVITSDFKDESTIAEEAPRQTSSGLSLVK